MSKFVFLLVIFLLLFQTDSLATQSIDDCANALLCYLLHIYWLSTDRGEVPAHVSDKDVGGGQGAVLLLLQLALQLQPQVGDVQLGDHSVYEKVTPFSIISKDVNMKLKANIFCWKFTF